MNTFNPDFLNAVSGLDCRENIPLSELTSFHIGGPASFVIVPKNEDELQTAILAVQKEGLPYRILGKGSNMLAPDEGYSGIVILIQHAFCSPSVSGTTFTVSAGMPLSEAVRASVAAGLSGLEALEGIPGTVGGACAMNAGAYGTEISSVLVSARIMKDGRVFDRPVLPEEFGYRKSPLGNSDTVIISAVFSLQKDDGHGTERIEDYARRRREKQPLDYPSAGSVFKRPEGYFAGTLIEQCGLKGLSVNGAAVSKRHAGFIINVGGATERDVKNLVSLIQKRVFDATGIHLERELKYWNEV